MPFCVNHPERETSYICRKHEIAMCEDCLECRDPNIYCKHRSACPIWFVHKERQREARRSREEHTRLRHKIDFRPDGASLEVEEGTNLLQAAQEAGVKLNASCNGAGSCGKCKLIVEQGTVSSHTTPLLSQKEKGENYILACQSTIHDDLTVRIPEETLEKRLRCSGLGARVSLELQGGLGTISPMLKTVSLKLDPPSLDDPVSDLDRLSRALRKQGFDIERMNVSSSVMRELARVIREENWEIDTSVIQKKCSNEILGVAPKNGNRRDLGLAVDLGTTTVMAYLIDMADGRVLAGSGGHNKQAACGDDVINRIVCAEKEGVKKLGNMALATVNGLINELLDSVGEQKKGVTNVVIAGNTTMTHLLYKLEPRYIRRTPYVPTVSEFPILKGAETGLAVNPSAAVFTVPGPASYVGGDIVSGVVSSKMHLEESLTLLIDIGTNGEIVLGNQQWLLTAACSAGPAFEGGGIKFGMRAEEGAIEKVSIDQNSQNPELSVIGNCPARGICGTGMIDLLSEMLGAKIISQSGRFQVDASHPRIKDQQGEPVYILEWAENSGLDQDIVFTQADIQNFIRSKGAVYAGIKVLLKQMGYSFTDLERFFIAGGFGEHLDVEKSVRIGLLPDIDRNRFEYLGNTSLAGAYLCLLGQEFRDQSRAVSNAMTYIDFSSNNEFMDEFTSALFLPHTQMQDFPSVT